MRKLLIALAALIVSAAIVLPEAEAARLGGGRSVGTQRSVTRTPPAATPAKPAQQQQAAPAGQPAPAPQAQPTFMQKWGPLLGGLAIGGLLGSLFAGNGLGGVLLLVLLALAAFVVIRVLMQRRAPQPMQYAGFQERGLPPEPARAAGAPQAVNAPAGFDTAAFLKGARMNFMKLQAANDAGNVEDLREFTTGEMFESLARDIEARGAARQQTDVAQLEADLLEVVTERDRHWASVRFSGLVRETPGAAAESFEEVWNLVKPADGSTGWLLAGIQQMN